MTIEFDFVKNEKIFTISEKTKSFVLQALIGGSNMISLHRIMRMPKESKGKLVHLTNKQKRRFG